MTASATVSTPASTRPRRMNRDRWKRLLKQLPAYLILGLWALFTIFVIGWVVVSSFKTNAEIFRDVFKLPAEWQWTNYAKAWQAANFAVYFQNSVIVTTVSVIFLLAISA